MRPVKAGLSVSEKVKIALGAREWHDAWWDCRARNAHGQFWDDMALAKFNYKEMTATENLKEQDRVREKTLVGWNPKLASNAREFHRLSEENIGKSPIELFVFWSKGTATLGAVQFNLPPYDPDPNVMYSKWTVKPWGERLTPLNMGVTVNDYFAGEYPKVNVSSSFDFKFESWDRIRLSGRQPELWKFFWNITAILVDGDGTVPRASLLGIGSPRAKIFNAIPDNPEHVPAPNHNFVWDRVLDVLTARSVSAHLASDPAINPTTPQNQPWAETATTL
jgi:hypothetical protein